MANSLLSKGVDVDLQNPGVKYLGSAFLSSLEFAAYSGCDKALFGLLLERSKCPYKLDKNGYSLVH